MMDVTFDNIIFGLQHHGGISVYWSELLKRGSKEGASWIEPEQALLNLNRKLLSLELHSANTFLPTKLDRYASVTCNSGILHSSYYRIPKNKKTKLVTSVYDFTYERYRHGPALWVHHRQKMRAITHSNAIICISESTARDVVKFGGKELSPRIKVTYLAASENFRLIADARPKLELVYPWLASVLEQKRIVLFVGARSNYKRFDLAVHAVEKKSGFHLVVIGGGQPSSSELELTNRLSKENRIHFVPAAPAAEVPLWYNISFALLYLSEYEGFGLPVIEASLCDCPVIAQNSSSIPELYADQTFLLPNSATTNHVLERLTALENGTFRTNLVKACESKARTFSWHKCWEATKEVYGHL